MSKKIKLLILMLSIPTVYIIYILCGNKNINYISLGDDIALGINSYGIANYSYSDYFKDYLEKNKSLNLYTNDFSNKGKTIIELYNDILINKKKTINKKTYNIKKIMRESDIMTLSIGQNDIRFELNNLNKEIATKEDYDNISEKIYLKYDCLLKEINKYFKGELYIIGTYYKTEEEKEVSKRINKKIQEYIENKNISYINLENIIKKDSFNNSNSKMPNDEVYYIIGNELIRSYNSNK